MYIYRDISVGNFLNSLIKYANREFVFSNQSEVYIYIPYNNKYTFTEYKELTFNRKPSDFIDYVYLNRPLVYKLVQILVAFEPTTKVKIHCAEGDMDIFGIKEVGNDIIYITPISLEEYGLSTNDLKSNTYKWIE